MKTLFGRSLIPVLIIAILLAILFLAFAWYEGLVQLPALPFLQGAGGSPTSLDIQVIPPNARIALNGKTYDRRAALLPGDYEVTVSRDGYYSTTEHIRVHPNTPNEVHIQLAPVVAALAVTEAAVAPAWDGQGSLYFISQADGKIYRWAKGSKDYVAAAQGEVQQLVVSADGNRGYLLAARGSDSPSQLSSLDLRGGNSTDLPVSGYVTLVKDGKTIWGVNTDPNDTSGKQVWSLEQGGSPKWLSVESPEWAMAALEAVVDASGQLVAVSSSRGIAVWETSSGKQVTTFAGASTPLWVDGSESGLVYRAADGSLSIATPDAEWRPTPVATDVPAPLAALPGTTEIVFTRYDPFAGGASFWAVDAETGGIRLLAEAAVESGHVSEFAISPDGKKIAWVNDRGTLYVVTLEP